jgi:plastocyanin
LTRSALTLAALALLAAGCGGGDPPGRTATVPASGVLRVEAQEYGFDPSTIVVPRPATVRLLVDNRGSLAHNLKVEKDDRVIGGTPSFRAGEQRWTKLRLARGTYQYLCTVGDHAELGMRGTLKVG